MERHSDEQSAGGAIIFTVLNYLPHLRGSWEARVARNVEEKDVTVNASKGLPMTFSLFAHTQCTYTHMHTRANMDSPQRIFVFAILLCHVLNLFSYQSSEFMKKQPCVNIKEVFIRTWFYC